MIDDDPAAGRQSNDGETIDSSVVPGRPEPTTEHGAGKPAEPSGAMFTMNDVAQAAGPIPTGATKEGAPAGYPQPEPTALPTQMFTMKGHPDEPDLGRTEAFGTALNHPAASGGPEATANWTVGQYLGAGVPQGSTVELGGAKTEPGGPDAPKRRGRGPGAWPTIPGHEILGELGRGGMGVVYKAHNQRLDIPVALKMVLAGAHASSEQLERFEGEARAVAKLRHPNIVSIYHIEEHDGLPYFSLEFLEGGTLASKLAGKPQPTRQAAEMAETLARAMLVAHRANIIHRDLKPANILLAADGTPKITDFGLAKQLEEAEDGSARGSGSTRTGAVMGTPSYMAPEQAWGRIDEIGPKADQFALGAILYEMLTGRPPFQGANALETLDLVRNREPVPPTQLQPKLPKDIETICLKALQKEPAKRYADVGAMADDLRRFQNNEPIVARPVSTPERLWRWCRRNQWLAVSLAGTAAALLIAAVGGLAAAIIISQQNVELGKAKKDADRARDTAVKNEGDARRQEKIAQEQKERAEKSKEEEQKQKEIAETQNNLAIGALQELVSNLQKTLRTRADLQELRQNLLQTAASRISEIERLNQHKSNAADLITAKLYQTFGEIHQEMGQLKEAGESFAKMDAVIAAMEQTLPGDVGVKNARAKTLNVLGDLQFRAMGNAEAALPYYEQALKLREELVEDFRKTNPAGLDQAKDGLGTNYGLMGDVQMKLGHPREAYELYLKEKALRDDLSPEFQVKARGLRASLLDKMGTALIKLGQHEEGRKQFDEARALREEWARASQDNIALWNNLYLSLHNLGHVQLLQENDPAEALRLYQQALDGFKDLSTRDPKNVTFRKNLGLSHYLVGEAQRRLKMEESAASFRECLAIRRALAEASPQDKRTQLDFAITLARCGEAAVAAQTVEAVLKTLPTDNRHYFFAAFAYALAYGATEKGEASKPYADKAIAMLQRAARSGWADAESLRTDPDLDPIRDDPRFAALAEAIEKAAAGGAVALAR